MKAFNSQNNLIAAAGLLLAFAVHAESYCSLPGERLMQDPSGDDGPRHAAAPSAGALIKTAAPAGPLDIQAVYWAEPHDLYSPDTDRVIVTLKVASLASLQPGTIYSVEFRLSDYAYYYVQFRSAPAPGDSPFTYGRLDPDAKPVELGDADPQSDYIDDGYINWVLSRKKIPALAANGEVAEIHGLSWLEESAGERAVMDVTDAGRYVLRGNLTCRPATLVARPAVRAAKRR